MAEATDLKSLARQVFLRNAASVSRHLKVSRSPLRGRDISRQTCDPIWPLSSVPAPYRRSWPALRAGCPDRIEVGDWQQAIEDGRRFLAKWGEQAAALGWRENDLFELHDVPDTPAPNYRRLSRRDQSGLIWLLRGRPVVALTTATAAIENPTGTATIYRRHPVS